MSSSEVNDFFSSSDIDSDFLKPHTLKSFDAGIDIVTSIAFGPVEPFCKNLAFISIARSSNLRLFDSEGREVQPTDVYRGPCAKISDIKMFNAEMCISCHDEKREHNYLCWVQKHINHEQNQLQLYMESPLRNSLYPTGLCILNNDSVAVCLVDKHSYDVNEDTHRMVCIYIYNSNHHIYDPPKTSIEFNGNERLYLYPKRIAQSTLGDLWVVNRLSEHAGNIVVTDISGGYKFVYRRCSQNLSFDPKDIATNKNESMIIADYRNHLVHLVKDDGSFLQYVMTNDDGLSFPSAVALDPFDRAWIGCDFGKMHIVRFNKVFE